jgi:hypothetical protein
MLDYLLGNTSVLIDRDRANATRRRVYGRAGEFRKQKHGLEYRTLSNFWLEAYPLMSFVTAMAKLAITIVNKSNKRHDYESAILNAVDGNDIRNAINTNSYALALKNWKKIEPVLLDMLEDGEEFHEEFPISNDNIREFRHFIRKGMEYWFKEDPIKHWTGNRGKYRGWEVFLRKVVKPDMA